MKALPTQFDNRRLATAVATPTCSSCCCCCCCLATSIASSTLLAQRISKEGEQHNVPDRALLTVAAALYLPIILAITYLLAWGVNTLLRTCTEHTYSFSTSTYQVCTNPAASLAFPLGVIIPVIVLWYLYTRVKVEKPFSRAIIVSILIAVAMGLEAFAGFWLILTGVGGIIYLVMIPFIVVWLTAWYHKHLMNEPGAAEWAAVSAAKAEAWNMPAEAVTGGEQKPIGDLYPTPKDNSTPHAPTTDNDTHADNTPTEPQPPVANGQ